MRNKRTFGRGEFGLGIAITAAARMANLIFAVEDESLSQADAWFIAATMDPAGRIPNAGDDITSMNGSSGGTVTAGSCIWTNAAITGTFNMSTSFSWDSGGTFNNCIITAPSGISIVSGGATISGNTFHNDVSSSETWLQNNTFNAGVEASGNVTTFSGNTVAGLASISGLVSMVDNVFNGPAYFTNAVVYQSFGGGSGGGGIFDNTFNDIASFQGSTIFYNQFYINQQTAAAVVTYKATPITGNYGKHHKVI